MYQCDKCLVAFSQIQSYISHVAANCKSKRMQKERFEIDKCAFCNKKILKHCMYDHVMRQHSMPKDKKSIAEEVLHEYVHNVPEWSRTRSKCPVCCIQVHVGYMDKHMAVHNRKQFQCEKCKVYFGSKFFLNEHFTKCRSN